MAHATLWKFLTIIIFCAEEPEEGRDTLSILRVIEVVAPAIERPVSVGVIAGKRVLIPRAGVQGDGRDDPGHVDVGQAVGKVVNVVWNRC